LGEADEAVRELEALPRRAWNHPSANKARVAAVEVLGKGLGRLVRKLRKLRRNQDYFSPHKFNIISL
jgi:hypothetical protein